MAICTIHALYMHYTFNNSIQTLKLYDENENDKNDENEIQMD